MSVFPLVLSSPSGGGKTTIARALIAAREDLGYSISATTRAPRDGETDGRDYYFLGRGEFERKAAAGEFAEWTEYGGDLYGTLRSELDGVVASGRHPVLAIEVQGARAVRAQYADAVLVFIVPPSADELLKRLRERGTTDGATLERRMRRAQQELEAAGEYDYVVVNADRTEALADVAAILDAELRRPTRNPDLPAQLRDLGRDIARLADVVSKTGESRDAGLHAG